MLPFFIQACVLWFSLFFSNYLLVFHYFNKHEDNFRNSKIVEFVILTHARSVGFWWDPIYEIFSLIDWLLCLIGLPHSMTCMRLFYICVLTLSLLIALNLWLRYASYSIAFIDLFIIMHVLLSHIWSLFGIHV